VIELHGEQHYKPVTFGGITREEAEENFRQQNIRDENKRKAAEEAGWIYIVFKFDEEINMKNLMGKIQNFKPKYQTKKTPYTPVNKQKSPKRQEDPVKRQQRLAYAREARKKAYQAKKQWIKNNRKRR
jgi:hypothetical protein